MLVANSNWTFTSALDTPADGAYGVEVLDLKTLDGNYAQDQLLMIPEPSVLLSLGICLVGVAVTARRFNIQT